jgi:methyl-accepting chemotaxis protein
MPLTQDNISAARNALNERTKDINKATAKINDASKKVSNITKDYSNNVKSFNDSVNSINLNSAFTDNLALGLSGLIADPFATAIQKIMSKINELVPKIESKIDKLEQDLVKKVDNKGRVTIPTRSFGVAISV